MYLSVPSAKVVTSTIKSLPYTCTVSGMDSTPLLNCAGAAAVVAADGDYVELKGLREVRKVFWIETRKIWQIALPIVFNIWCQYGVNSITNIFVGHLGDLELSAASLINSVIGTFAFGFMVSVLFWIVRGRIRCLCLATTMSE